MRGVALAVACVIGGLPAVARANEPPLTVYPIGERPSNKFGLCQGHCTSDIDCRAGLQCFERNERFEAVPGCMGGENDWSLTSYCVDEPNPADSPPSSPQFPDIFSYPSDDFPSDGIPLGRCEGHCESDDQCENGLVCFEREMRFMAVPGCRGGENDWSLNSYCTVNSLSGEEDL